MLAINSVVLYAITRERFLVFNQLNTRCVFVFNKRGGGGGGGGGGG